MSSETYREMEEPLIKNLWQNCSETTDRFYYGKIIMYKKEL